MRKKKKDSFLFPSERNKSEQYSVLFLLISRYYSLIYQGSKNSINNSDYTWFSVSSRVKERKRERERENNNNNKKSINMIYMFSKIIWVGFIYFSSDYDSQISFGSMSFLFFFLLLSLFVFFSSSARLIINI